MYYISTTVISGFLAGSLWKKKKHK
jgi:hypothetical protein